MSRSRAAAVPLAVIGLASGCGEGAGAGGSPPRNDDGPRLQFREATAEAGLDGFRQRNGDPEKRFITETVGGGVALLDYDGDGDLDAYLTNGSAHEGFPPGEEPQDALYQNDGAARFRERTREAGLGDRGWTTGARAADVDGDGWTDLYLSNHGPNVHYRNRGDGTFQDVTASSGTGVSSWSTGAAFLDHDRDGDLDLFVANYIDFDLEWVSANARSKDYRGVRVMVGPRGLPPSPDVLLENEDGGFRDVSEQAGIAALARYGLGCVVLDHDVDGWIDVYVANDSEANSLWRNDGGHFEDVAFRCGLAVSRDGAKQAGMGIAVGDPNGDLLADLFVTNFSEDYFVLYRGVGGGFFEDVTHRVGLAGPTLSSLGWGCGFHDFDNDGDEDLVAVNGHVYPQVDRFDFGTRYLQQNLLFENDAGRFRMAPGGGGAGFGLEEASRGSAVGDLDGDGDLDLLVGNIDGPPALLLNETAGAGRSVALRLVGAGANRDAIGARVVATFGDRRALRLVGTAAGFLSSDGPFLHFGVGDADGLDEVEVVWPGGQSERFGPIAAGGPTTIRQGEGSAVEPPPGG